MFKAVFAGAGELAIYPVISLLLFLSIFVGVLVWVFRLNKPHLEHMSKLPLENNSAKGGTV